MFQGRAGLASLLKEGSRHFSGTEEAVLRNIDASLKLTQILKTSLGPNSMNKLIVSHFGKTFVTSDAATVVEQLEVQHPAAKMLVNASKMQEEQFGDGTNFVIVFAGELLSQAESMIKQGLHTADIIRGYEMASEEVVRVLPSLEVWSLENPRNEKEVEKAVCSVVASKQIGSEADLARLVAQAAIKVMPSNVRNFNVENIRITKIPGGALIHSEVVDGMLLTRAVVSDAQRKENSKVLILGVGLEHAAPEAKGTVLLQSAEELLQFSAGDEASMEKCIKDIKDAGVDVLVVGGHISDIAQHYVDKYDMLAIRVQSKFELNRLAKTLGATVLARLGVPTAEEMGHVDLVDSVEIGSKKCTLVKSRDSKIATIVLRGATQNMLDEVERCLDDGISCIRAMVQDPRYIPGAGAADIELAHQLKQHAKKQTGMEQYAVDGFANALEVVPSVLAENAGHSAMETITELYSAHAAGKATEGVNIEGGRKQLTMDVVNGPPTPILDHAETKIWAIKSATDAAVTVLRVDQIIMSKPAGGPKPPQNQGHWDAQDDNAPLGD